MQNREQNCSIDFEHMDCRPRDIMEEIMNAARNQIISYIVRVPLKKVKKVTSY